MKNIEKKIIWSVVFGLVVYVVISTFSDLSSVWQNIKNISIVTIILILFLSCINYLIRFFRWEFLLRTLNIKLGIKDSLLIFLSGFVMSVTPGKFGEVFKSYLIKKKDNIEIARTMPVVMSERITDLFALLVIITLGLMIFDYGKIIVLITWVVMILVIISLGNELFARKIFIFLKKIKNKKINKIGMFIEKTYESIKVVLHPKQLLIGIILGVFAWSAEGLGLYIILKDFNTITPLAGILFVYSFSTLVGAIAMLPGGLGATEGSMAGLLVLLVNVPRDIAISSTLIIRMATLWFAVAIGLVSLSIFTKKTKINEKELDSVELVK